MREFSANPKKAQKGVIREGLERSPGPLRRLACCFSNPRTGAGVEVTKATEERMLLKEAAWAVCESLVPSSGPQRNQIRNMMR